MNPLGSILKPPNRAHKSILRTGILCQQYGHVALAVSLDEQKAFDSICANTVVTCPRFMGFEGRVLRILGCYLNGRSLFVKLGKALSTRRPRLMGLLQESLLNPPLFNVVMVIVTPSLQQCPSTVSATFCADNIPV